MQAWLLREGVVEQLQTFVHLVLPSTFPTFARRGSTTSLPVPQAESPLGTSDEIPLSPTELRTLEVEKAGRDSSAYAQLLRFGRYFRGRVSVQEMLWREGEDPLVLEGVFREFKRLLVKSERPMVL